MKIKVSTLNRFLLIAALVFASGCTVTNKYEPYMGKVIDGETKQPIEGAAVLIVYYFQHFGLAGSVTDFADAQETLTDKNGEFRIPAIRLYKFSLLSGWERYPGVTVFKPGYGCYPWHKGAASSHRDPNRMILHGEVPSYSLPSEKHVTIELPRLKTREERLRNQSCFPVSVPDKKMPQFIKANNIERIYLGLDPTHIEEAK